MRFVIGSSAGAYGVSSSFDLGHELNLVKAALLYADRVELVSVGVSILAGWEDLTRRVEEEFESYNARGLREAVASGLLELHSFGHTEAEGLPTMAADKVPVSAAVEDVVLEYVERASVAMEGLGYPLFDALVGDLVGESVRAGLIVPGRRHRGRHGGISGDLIRRLPLFEEATVEEVLGVRREMERSLRGFRLVVSEFSGQVAFAAWEPGFAAEADTLFREKVEPEVAGIEEALQENRSLRELAWRTARHGRRPAQIVALRVTPTARRPHRGLRSGR